MQNHTSRQRNFSERQADESDFDFAWALYVASTRPLLTMLGNWNEANIKQRFRKSFNAGQARIICSGATGIGWIQVSESALGFHLHQIHIDQRFRNRGIGTELISKLLAFANEKALPVSLNVIRNNPAKRLYERLGFQVIDEDDEKFHMQLLPG